MWNPQGIYNQYMLRIPALITGKECVKGLYNYPCAKVAVIHGSTVNDEGLFRETFKKKDVRFFPRSWNGEPDLEGLSETLHELEVFRPDTIVAMGGGSVIDGTKLCRLFLEIPNYRPEASRFDGKEFTTRFIAIPTTVGSGAEVSSAAVYVNRESGCKQMVVMHELQPDIIAYDDRYVRNTPERLLCASVLDTFAHIVEGYVSNIANCVVETIAEAGLSILADELEKLVHNQTDDVDFYKLLYAGQIGGIVQNHCIVGAAHAVAHQLTGYGFSHGEAVALLLPAVVRLNAEDADTNIKYDRIARKAGFKCMYEMAEFVRTVCSIGNIECRRSELEEVLRAHVDDEKFVANIMNDRGGKGNPVEIDGKYLIRLVNTV